MMEGRCVEKRTERKERLLFLRTNVCFLLTNMFPTDYLSVNNRSHLESLESRRNFTREVMEKQVAHQIEAVNSKLLGMESKIIRYGVGLIGTTAVVATGIARIVL